MAFTYLKAKSAKCLCVTSGGLGLKNLVLFTSLVSYLISYPYKVTCFINVENEGGWSAGEMGTAAICVVTDHDGLIFLIL